MTRPNILWICADQQRWDTLGCTGNRFVRTPQSRPPRGRRRRCSSGAYCQSPVCTPSRASFLTGRYPRTTRTRQNGQDIPDGRSARARSCSRTRATRAGWRGSCTSPPATPPSRPAWSGASTTAMRSSTGRTIRPCRSEQKTNHDWPTNEYNHWLRERGARYERRAVPGLRGMCRSGLPAEHHQTTWCAEKAMSFIEAQCRRKRGRGCSRSTSSTRTTPSTRRAAYLQRYLDRLDTIPLPAYVPGELERKPAFQTHRPRERLRRQRRLCLRQR